MKGLNMSPPALLTAECGGPFTVILRLEGVPLADTGVLTDVFDLAVTGGDCWIAELLCCNGWEANCTDLIDLAVLLGRAIVGGSGCFLPVFGAEVEKACKEGTG